MIDIDMYSAEATFVSNEFAWVVYYHRFIAVLKGLWPLYRSMCLYLCKMENMSSIQNSTGPDTVYSNNII